MRFYSAEALAYLDQKEAAAPLAEAARDVPAFRAYAMAALSAMDDLAAYEGLRELLDMPSNETRYGDFRSLWAMNAQDALVRGQKLSDQFSYHVLDTMGRRIGARHAQLPRRRSSSSARTSNWSRPSSSKPARTSCSLARMIA